MIQLHNVTKFFTTSSGRHYVLENVSFTIPDDSRVGVVGPNGAGKSTLMRLLAFVDIPNSGTITRTGSISWPMGLATGLQLIMTGRENARFGCRIQGLSSQDISERVIGIAEFCDIGKYFDMPVRTYSSGMRARLNFAIAMAFDFDCYIIDELTAVGDQDFKAKSKKVFEEKRKNASFIKVSHSMAELKNECDCGILLHNAKAHFYPTFEQTLAAYKKLQAGNKHPPKAKPKPKPTPKAAPKPAARKTPETKAAPKPAPIQAPTTAPKPVVKATPEPIAEEPIPFNIFRK